MHKKMRPIPNDAYRNIQGPRKAKHRYTRPEKHEPSRQMHQNIYIKKTRKDRNIRGKEKDIQRSKYTGKD